MQKGKPRKPVRRWPLVALAVLVVGALVYQLPPVKNRLSWRLDYLGIYIAGVFNPIGSIPDVQAGLPEPQVVVTQGQVSTPSTQTVPTKGSGPTATPAATPTPAPLPVQVVLPAPKWEAEDMNNCGPTTLAMHLRMFGWQGDQQTIASKVKPHRDDRNVNVEELVSYVHTDVPALGVVYRVGGTVERLRSFLAAGIPVTIEESLILKESYWPNDDRWAGHYLLLTGYDDSQHVFITQDSELGANQVVRYEDLVSDWQSFNHVYIVLYRPEQEATVRALLGPDWDADANRQNTLQQAVQKTQETPNDGYAWFNMGTNLVYFDRYGEAVSAYERAIQAGLPQRMFRYQFGPFMAYFYNGNYDALIKLADYALRVTPNSEEAMLWKGWGLYRTGQKDQAVELFQKALEQRPGYSDAEYALQFAQSQ